MTMPDTGSFLSKALAGDEDRPKLPTLKFESPGDAYTLTITEKAMVQQTEYNPDPNAAKVQKFWDDGSPMMMLALSGTLEDGSEHRLFIKGKLQTAAVAKAVADAGEKDINPGGKLWIKFTGWEKARSGYNAKAYEAAYKAGAAPSPSTTDFLASSGGGGKSAPASDAPPF